MCQRVWAVILLITNYFNCDITPASFQLSRPLESNEKGMNLFNEGKRSCLYFIRPTRLISLVHGRIIQADGVIYYPWENKYHWNDEYSWKLPIDRALLPIVSLLGKYSKSFAPNVCSTRCWISNSCRWNTRQILAFCCSWYVRWFGKVFERLL